MDPSSRRFSIIIIAIIRKLKTLKANFSLLSIEYRTVHRMKIITRVNTTLTSPQKKKTLFNFQPLTRATSRIEK